jgi:hypothetical protein
MLVGLGDFARQEGAEFSVVPTEDVPNATGKWPDITAGALADQVLCRMDSGRWIAVGRGFTVTNFWENRPFVAGKRTIVIPDGGGTCAAIKQIEDRSGSENGPGADTNRAG